MTKSNLRVRIFLPVFVVACLASLAYVFLRPAVYVSTARLQVEASSSQSPGEEGDTRNLLTAAQALTSNTVLERVTRELGGAPSVSPEALRGMLRVAPVSGTNVVELRGEGGDRELLPRVLSAWLEAWRQTETDARDQSSTAALGDARSHVEQLKQDVATKRRELELFRKRFDIVSLEREENQAAARLKGLNTAMNDARSREITAEARLKTMQENMAAGRPATGSERSIVVELEKRAADLRDRMKDLEQEYTSQYLALDPKYKAMRANLSRVEQQIEQERRASARQAMHGAEEELASARQTVVKLQQELSGRKREAQDFASRFSEHAALAKQLLLLEGSYDIERQRLAVLEKDSRVTGPKLTVLSPPSVPDRPDRPDYGRDALIAVLGSGVLALSAVWFVEFFRRSGVPRPEPVGQQPIIHISYPPPGVVFDSAMPVLGASAQRVPETIAHFPRELSGPEVHALWGAALPEARLVIAGLLNGFSLEELAALRYKDIDSGADCAHVPGASGRSLTLRDPMRRLLIERRATNEADAPLANPQGGPLSTADLEGLIACAACDAGLADPTEVTSETLRHTYFAYLIRQGARLADIGEFIGRISPAAFREYGRLSPPGPGLPLEQIDPVFPALRSPLV